MTNFRPSIFSHRIIKSKQWQSHFFWGLGTPTEILDITSIKMLRESMGHWVNATRSSGIFPCITFQRTLVSGSTDEASKRCHGPHAWPRCKNKEALSAQVNTATICYTLAQTISAHLNWTEHGGAIQCFTLTVVWRVETTKTKCCYLWGQSH